VRSLVFHRDQMEMSLLRCQLDRPQMQGPTLLKTGKEILKEQTTPQTAPLLWLDEIQLEREGLQNSIIFDTFHKRAL
jgi:hypothetical protein